MAYDIGSFEDGNGGWEAASSAGVSKKPEAVVESGKIEIEPVEAVLRTLKTCFLHNWPSLDLDLRVRKRFLY
jgi:hypothetical protein